jgi:hypothetical protein
MFIMGVLAIKHTCTFTTAITDKQACIEDRLVPKRQHSEQSSRAPSSDTQEAHSSSSNTITGSLGHILGAILIILLESTPFEWWHPFWVAFLQGAATTT